MAKIKYNLGVIYILWLRQLKRHFRSRSRLVASIGQPLLFLVALGFGFKSVYAAAGEGNYIQFLAPGIIAMSVVFSAMFGGIEVIVDKQFGFLKETLVAPVSRLIIMLGRTMGGATVAVFQGLAVLVITTIFGFSPHSVLIVLATLIFMFLIALFFTTLGTSFASFFNDMQAFPIVINFVVMPLFFLSGALFPVEGLPAALNFVVRINPLTYGVDGVRGALIGQFQFSPWLDLAVLAGVTFILLIIGSYLFKKIQI
jgi:ABC-2 type transport system permease protein